MKSPINDNIAKAVHASKPRSWIYPGICADTKVMLNPHTKNPATSKPYPLCEKASFIASVKFWLFSVFKIGAYFFGKINNETISPNKIKYIKYFKVCSQPTVPRVYCVNSGAKK